MWRTPREDDAFTLIELLVVIVVLGVLAGIAVPVFLGQREKAWRSTALSDMKNASLALETWATDHGGDYTGLDGVDQDSALLQDQGFNRTEWVSLVVRADVSGYCIQGKNAHLPGRQFVYRSTAGTVEVQVVGSPAC